MSYLPPLPGRTTKTEASSIPLPRRRRTSRSCLRTRARLGRCGRRFRRGGSTVSGMFNLRAEVYKAFFWRNRGGKAVEREERRQRLTRWIFGFVRYSTDKTKKASSSASAPSSSKKKKGGKIDKSLISGPVRSLVSSSFLLSSRVPFADIWPDQLYSLRHYVLLSLKDPSSTSPIWATRPRPVFPLQASTHPGKPSSTHSHPRESLRSRSWRTKALSRTLFRRRVARRFVLSFPSFPSL
jgi:hypothetical protein